MFIEFGWAGAIGSDRWCPITVFVSGGTEPFDGLVIARYAQDATQSAQITVPAAVTPGKTVPVVLGVNLPPTCNTIEFRLQDRAGRLMQKLVYTGVPAIDELPFPDTLLAGRAIAVGVPADARDAGPAAGITTMAGRPDQRPKSGDDGIRPGTISPTRLPTSWGSYESLGFLAVEADVAARADPRAVAAVREWVAGGGRLMVIATGAGESWRAWLPPVWAEGTSDIFTVGEAMVGSMPPDLASALATPRIRGSSLLERFPTEDSSARPPGVVPEPGSDAAGETQDQTVPSDAADEPAEGEDAGTAPPAPTPEPAGVIMQRPISLTPRGAAAGWSLRWPVEGSEGKTGLLVEGPVGFGWVTVVGIDPRQAATVVSELATGAVWTDAAGGCLRDAESLAWSGEVQRYGEHRYVTRQDRSAAGYSAIFDRLSDAAGTGSASFGAIAAVMIVLAAMLGPFDALVLKRLRLAHRSWLTALAWIGLAAVAAYYAPTLGRSRATTVARVSVIDAIAPGGDGAVPALAWQHSVTGVFANSTLRAAFDGPYPGAWWRGISAVDEHVSSNAVTGSLVRSAQAPTDLATLGRAGGDPWGGFGTPEAARREGAADSGGRGGNALLPVQFRLWTFRTFEDQSRAAAPVLAAIEPVPSNGSVEATDDAGARPAPEPVVRLSPLPPGATVAAAACRIGGRWRQLSFTPDATDRLVSPLGAPTDLPPPEWAVPALQGTVSGWGHGHPGGRGVFRPHHGLVLTGPTRRGAAVESMLAGVDGEGQPRWAAVYLMLESMPADVSLAGETARRRQPVPTNAEYTRTVVCRILVPVPSGVFAAAAPPAPDPIPPLGETQESPR